jgi:hypothetical protein
MHYPARCNFLKVRTYRDKRCESSYLRDITASNARLDMSHLMPLYRACARKINKDAPRARLSFRIIPQKMVLSARGERRGEGGMREHAGILENFAT